MSLHKNNPVVKLEDRRNANRGDLGRSTSGGSSKGTSSNSLPPLHPWDGTFAFDLIREITSPDSIDNIPKYDYYRSTHDTPKISLYQVPGYLIDHVNDLAVIGPRKSHSRDAMFCAGVLHGAKRFYSSQEYNSLAVQYTRYTDSKLLLSPEDCDDVSSILSSIHLREDNCGSGWRKQVSYRVPDYIKVQLLPDSSALRLSFSSLAIRFYMDALREQQDDFHAFHLSSMTAAIDGDLYPKVGRVAWRLETLLDSLGIDPAQEERQR
jgi:hypothetical protein